MPHLCATASLLLILSAEAPQIDWELAASKDGVEVFTGHKQGSRFKAFKAVTRIEASPAEILGVLLDVERYVDWFAYTKRAKVLEATADARTIYLETEFPWPFANEDMIYKMSQTTTDQTVRLALEGVPSCRPRIKGVQRMKGASGHIEVRSVGTLTEVTYTMHTELGGSIPFWLANKNLHELPLRTLGNLKGRLEREPAPRPAAAAPAESSARARPPGCARSCP